MRWKGANLHKVHKGNNPIIDTAITYVKLNREDINARALLLMGLNQDEIIKSVMSKRKRDLYLKLPK